MLVLCRGRLAHHGSSQCLPSCVCIGVLAVHSEVRSTVTDIDYFDCPSKTTNLSWSPRSGVCPSLSQYAPSHDRSDHPLLYPHHPVLQYPLLRTPDRMDWTGSPEWLSLPSSSASPLRSRPPVSLRPCGPVDDGIDESEACAAGARTSLDRTPAKLRSPPIPNPRRPHRGGLLDPPGQAPSSKSTDKDRYFLCGLVVKTGCSHHEIFGAQPLGILSMFRGRIILGSFWARVHGRCGVRWCCTAPRVVGWKIIVTTMYMQSVKMLPKISQVYLFGTELHTGKTPFVTSIVA